MTGTADLPSLPPTDPTRSGPPSRRFYVTYHDVDALNHLNHAVYFPFMETLRCDYYLPLTHSSDPRTLDIILAEASCRYLAPVRYGDELLGEVAPSLPLGRTSFSLLYRFRNARTNVPTARGRTVIVCYDYEKATKKEIPPDRRAILQRDAVDPTSADWA